MRTLRFEVRSETFARLRQVQQVLDAEAGAHLDDDALISAMCEAVLHPREQARDKAQHQILMIECERCGQGWQEGAGVRVAIDKAAMGRAQCDAERIDPSTLHAAQSVRPAVRRFVWRRDGGRCCFPGCRSTRNLELHHIRSQADGGSHAATNLTLLCGAHHRALHEGKVSISGRAPRPSIKSAHVGNTVETVAEEVLSGDRLGTAAREGRTKKSGRRKRSVRASRLV